MLYGGEGCVKSFSSDKDVVCDTSDSDCPCKYPYCLPRATVQISNPMALSANLQDNANPITVCRTFPTCVIDYLDGEPAQPETQRVLVTIGIFTITRLERDVQITIPSYDFVFHARNVRQRPMIRAKFSVKLIFLQTHSFRRTQYTVVTVTLLIHLLLNAVVKTDCTEKRG